MEEALEWAKKCPDPMPGEESDLEIRPYVSMEDFGEAATPELKAKEASLRETDRRGAPRLARRSGVGHGRMARFPRSVGAAHFAQRRITSQSGKPGQIRDVHAIDARRCRS